jgi:hypothetical protein
MKGIYLTEESKQEIEAKLRQIRINDRGDFEDHEDYLNRKFNLEQDFIDNLLSSATILPVEESWQKVKHFYRGNSVKSSEEYPNGVIIQPKQ